MTPEQIFSKFVPRQAVSYCVQLYEKWGFAFKIKKARRTKLGDYTYDPAKAKHTISINNNLNPYAFLFTYLHEVGHLIAFKKYGRKILPHGTEWKNSFREATIPLLKEEVFPPEVLKALIKYFQNPKASGCADPTLYNILKQFDAEASIQLKDIAVGHTFFFNNRKFKKLEKKRTRSICQESESGKKYIISEIADVSLSYNKSEAGN